MVNKKPEMYKYISSNKPRNNNKFILSKTGNGKWNNNR